MSITAQGKTTDKLDSVIDRDKVKVLLVDSSGNTVPITNIGELTDYINVPYTFGINTILAHLNTIYYHIHGQSFVYPNHANNVTLTSGVGAWNLTGTIKEVIPAGALNIAAFDLHWITVSDISANSELQIDIYSGTAGNEVLIGGTRPSRTAVLSQEGARRIQVSQQIAGSRISCRLSDSTAGSVTCKVSFEGHYYA